MNVRNWQKSYRPIFNLLILLALMLAISTNQAIAQRQTVESDKPLDNADILAMKRAGIGTSVILAAIKYAPLEHLDSSSEALTVLRKSGVEDAVITAITGRIESRQKSATAATSSGDNPTAHARKPADIKLFFTDKPTESFRELGRVSASKYGTFGRERKREVIDEELKSKAAELGGDAIINITEDFASVSGVVVAFQK